MADHEATYAFTIPSIADDLALDCRIYHPKTIDRSNVKGAIIAHPYAPLGGCYEDPVVLSTTETLLDRGFIVGTFNFRCDT
jgi:alpha/beta superfamily hydrolase